MEGLQIIGLERTHHGSQCHTHVHFCSVESVLTSKYQVQIFQKRLVKRPRWEVYFKPIYII